jgi:DNA-directed RNA polymerase subunit M/transcription elongation factor TFIIS
MNKCPKCGTVMCEKFDERSGPKGITLAIPNGKFSCMRCGYDTEVEQGGSSSERKDAK